MSSARQNKAQPSSWVMLEKPHGNILVNLECVILLNSLGADELIPRLVAPSCGKLQVGSLTPHLRMRIFMHCKKKSPCLSHTKAQV
jgi:hypothetical protein